MNQYQKVYMNQIHSSSLLGQLAQMWRSQMLCDALIRTGNITTKAHRVVLVAACPMLQSMDNASVGSHLEVRLAADIKQEAVNSFLQYLYEGFMMLTEDNCKDVEKVARLLQVDSVTKCCIDFYSCLQKKTGAQVYSNTQYKYSSADLLEFRHVRTTDLQKTVQERMMKRAAADSMRPMSPSGKRQRMQQQQRPLSPNIDLAMFGQKADDTLSMAHSYMGNIGNQASDPWERVPRIGGVHNQRPQPKPGVIEIVEDSLEILQTQPPDKDGNKSAPPVIQKSLAISVSSQVNSSTDVHVVNVNDTSSHPTAATDGPIMSTGRDSITVSPLTVMPGSSSLTSSSTSSPLTKDQHKPSYDNQKEMSDRGPQAKKSQSLEQQSSTPQRGLFPVSMSPVSMSPINQVNQPKKSFAAGSASQAASMSQTNDSSSTSKRPSTSTVEIVDRPPSSDSSKELGTKSKVDDGSASNSTDMAPDLSIVKVEPTMEDPGLDMYVDVPEDSILQAQHRDQREHDDESDLELEEASGDWSRDEMSNEAGGSDQNNSWYIGQFKGFGEPREMYIRPADNRESYQPVAVDLFQDWLRKKYHLEDIEYLSSSLLNDYLGQFYIDMTGDGFIDENTLKEIRNSLVEFITQCKHWSFEVCFEELSRSNFLLDSLCNTQKDVELTPGKNKGTKKFPMTRNDLKLLMSSTVFAVQTPIGLLRKVWYDLTVHLGVCGQDALRSIQDDSLVFETDEYGFKYCRLSKTIEGKGTRSQNEMQNWDWDARMYEIPGDPNCPINSLNIYMSKRNLNQKAFFQRPKAVTYSEDVPWYDSPLGHCILARLMSKMSDEAKLSRMYTNSTIRLTAATILEERGINVLHVMNVHPRYKSSNQLAVPQKTSQELLNASNTLHDIMYNV